MSKRHVAFIVESAHGHVNPTLGTATELVRRGYRVSHAVKSYFAKRVEASGSEAHVYQPMENKLKIFKELQTGDGLGDFEFDFSGLDYSRYAEMEQQEIEDTVEQLENRYRHAMPDVVIFDRTNLAGRALARKYSIPTIEYSPMLIDKEFGHYEYDENLVIVTLPKFFQKDADELGSQFQFVGPVFNTGTFFEPWSGKSREIILVSATTGLLPQVEYFVRASHALGDLPYRVVLSIGDDIEPANLGSLPENCELNRFSSQPEILANARLFVSHGGPSSILEALRCGVPLLLLPPSQVHNAYAVRMAELGLGISLQKKEVSVERLRQAAMMLLNDTATLERVREVQADIGRSSGAFLAADLIEGFLTD